MDIKGKIYCLFEQSGTFKRAFQDLGYDAYDIDILNIFKQTDIQLDLFKEINKAYSKRHSIFDIMCPDDLCMAFFPCTYFSEANELFFTGSSYALRNMTKEQTLKYIIDRERSRTIYYSNLLKLCHIVETRNFRMIIENPYAPLGYLTRNFPYKPNLVDNNRTHMGDIYIKKTQYFFINCNPTYKPFKKLRIQHTRIDSESNRVKRSLITETYAHNFITTYILGESNSQTLPTLFDSFAEIL